MFTHSRADDGALIVVRIPGIAKTRRTLTKANNARTRLGMPLLVAEGEPAGSTEDATYGPLFITTTTVVITVTPNLRNPLNPKVSTVSTTILTPYAALPEDPTSPDDSSPVPEFDGQDENIA